jgi:trimeric autotransporter adhesin
MKRTAYLIAAALGHALSLNAATLTVTNVGDVASASTCVAPTPCSLRQAIDRANVDAVSDTITFAIAGAGPHIVNPSTQLPIITQPVFIDGYSQAGAVANTSSTGFNAVLKIQLSGGGIGNVANITGLRVQGSGISTIRGLSITDFSGPSSKAIEANGSGEVNIAGCAIGVTPVFAAATNAVGIRTGVNQTGAVRIGTLPANSPQAANLISENSIAVQLTATTAAQTGTSFISGNLVNVSANGSTLISSNTSITDARGGTLIANNVIGGSQSLALTSVGFVVTGNRVGGTVRISGAAAGLGTIGGRGVLANTIGSPTAASGPNQIQHEAQNLNVDFSLNHILSGGTSLGIDLAPIGISDNDTTDPDLGANGRQNFPILGTATRTSETGVVKVSGTLNSIPNRRYRLVFYANPSAVRAGQFLGDISTDVSTDDSGNASFGPIQLNFGNGTTVLSHVSATATLIDTVSNLPFATSEFAPPLLILLTPPVPYFVTSTGDPGDGVCNSSCTLREAIAAANADGSATAIDEIFFNIPGAGPHTIILASPLPALTQPVTIDGYTQPGALVNTDATGVGTNAVLKIEIQPAPLASFALFSGSIISSNITLRGLSINAFITNSSVLFLNAANTRIEGSWFGVRPGGDETITSFPLNFSSGSAIFGGASPAQRNIWNNRRSVSFAFQSSSQVSNSLFGVMPNGRVAASVSTSQNANPLLNMQAGSCDNNVFATSATGTALTANTTEVTDNAFGESFDGLTALTLGRAITTAGDNVQITSASHRVRNPQLDAIFSVGSLRLDQTIVGGAARGVVYGTAGDAAISIKSAIAGTAGLGIDLGGDGVSLNDLGDVDDGRQNFPVITSAARAGSTITVTGTLNSNASQNFRILICGMGGEHSSLHGGCDVVLDDQTIVTTAADGNAAFTVTLNSNPAHRFITATASRILNNIEEQTSEFALNIPITEIQEIILTTGFEGP